MCRALTVLCVAPDAASLAELKRAAVSADWELTPGATDEAHALEQLEELHPHVLVAIGDVSGVVAEARRRYPFLRIVTDRPAPDASAVVTELSEVREAVRGLPRPGGPIT